ncbi:MAG: sulfite exporter TauE/SafE family protein [Candidatus Paceibacterota bacterium]
MTTDFILISSFLMGLIINFDICPLSGDFAILSYIVREARDFKKTILHALSYTLGRITAYTSLLLIISLGFSRIDLSLFQGKGEVIIGAALIVFGLFSLRTEKHCCEHEHDKKPKNKTFFGSFLWGLLFSLGFCPHSAAIFFGMFVHLTATHAFSILPPVMFGLGASSIIMASSLVLYFSPEKGKAVLSKLEQKEATTKIVIALIFIAVGLLYLVK